MNKKIIIIIILLLVVILAFTIFGMTKKHNNGNHFNATNISRSSRFGVVHYSPELDGVGLFATDIQSWTWGDIEPNAPVNGQPAYKTSPQSYAIDNSIVNAGEKVFFDIGVESDWAIERDQSVRIIEPGTGKTDGAIMRIKPEYLNDYKSFISYLVKKYNISYLLVNSEAENVWGSADGYVEELCAAYQSAKQANPNIKIAAGGFNLGGLTLINDSVVDQYLSMSSEELNNLTPAYRHYVQKMRVTLGTLANGGNCFDILTIHHDHGKTYDTVSQVVQWYHQKMKAAGYDKPIWMDNMANGYNPEENSTDPSDAALMKGLTENNSVTINNYNKELPKWMVKKAVGNFSGGIEKVFLDPAFDPSSLLLPGWTYSGLFKHDGTPKAAYYTAKIMISKIGNFTKAEKLEGNSVGDHTYKFTLNDGNIVFVAWSDFGGKTIDLSNYISGSAKITHTATELDARNNPIYPASEIINSGNIKITEEPIFIEGTK